MRVAVVAMLVVCALGACTGTGAETQSTEPTVDATVPQPRTELANADRASLLAWKESLGPSYPLTIRGRDTVAALIQVVGPASAAWTRYTSTASPIFGLGGVVVE